MKSYKISLKIFTLSCFFILSATLSGCAFFGSCSQEEMPASIRAHKIVRTAYSQMGKKYRAGGASPKNGFDCSGLVWWTYRQHGINVPRITADQARAGKPVHKKALKAGDIVVFRTSQSPRGLHTGLYAGDGCFIHSPSSGKKVCMEKLSLPHWKNRLIAIRRVVP